MSDWPNQATTPLFIHPWTRYGPGHAVATEGSPGASTITWVANQAVYMPFYIPWEYNVRRVFWGNGSVGGANVDFGIYWPNGNKRYSTGSQAQSGTNVVQYLTPSTPFTLAPGSYYFGFACSGTTNTCYGNVVTTAGNGAIAGLLSQASAFALPDPATFATYGTPGMPFCGVTRTAAGTVF
jgi:hypothetical protein